MSIRNMTAALLLTFCMTSGSLFAQDANDGDKEGAEVAAEAKSEMLTIGSVAPPIDVEHWVQNGSGQFEPVTKFEDGKVYLVEFWATWCGPCIASMPHLSETQQKYADKGFQIISVSDEDLETVEEFLEKDVRGKDDMTYKELTSTYCLTTDPDGSVQKDYMRAAGQNGIPTAFIVGKSGHVEWIGHPMDGMDKAIEEVLGDEWDREAFAVTFKAKQEVDGLLSKLGRKMQQGKTDEVIEDLTKAIESSENEEVIAQLSQIRAQVMISTGAEGAADAMKELVNQADNADQLNQMAWAVVEMHNGGEDVSEDLISAAADAAKKGVALAPEDGGVIDTLAHLEYIQGNLDKALELTEKAAELSGDQFPEIKEFLKKLQAEKAEADKKDGEDDK